MSIEFPEPKRYVCTRRLTIHGPRFYGEVIDGSSLRNRKILVESRKIRAVPDDYPLIEFDGRLFVSQEAADAYANRDDRPAPVVVEPTNDAASDVTDESGDDDGAGDAGGEEEDVETIEEWGVRVAKLNKDELIAEVKSLGIEDFDADNTKAQIIEHAQIVLMERTDSDSEGTEEGAGSES